MKKYIKFLLPILTLLAILLVASPALAYGPEASADVEVSDITIIGGTGDIYYVSDTVTLSGTVTITAESSAVGPWSYAEAESLAGYLISGPDGIIAYDLNHSDDSEQGSLFNWSTSADASQTYSWTYQLLLNSAGDYHVLQGGMASAYSSFLWWSDEDFDLALSYLTFSAITRPAINDNWWQPTRGYFILGVGGYQRYKFTDGWDGNTLPDIEQTGIVYWNGESHKLKVVIPSGTHVSGLPWLKVNYYQGQLIFLTFDGKPIVFDNSIAVYELLDGEWIQIQ